MTIKVKPLIFGISGTSLTEDETKLFQENKVFGFILFSRNIDAKSQVINLTKSLKNLYPDRKVPIFIDQEGGRVARIKPPVIERTYPSAEHFSNLYEEDKMQAKHELKANYVELMSELRQLGIDSPCAPVCDILYKGASNVIGDRSFGNHADKVIDLCKAAISGIQHSGGIPFIKHIPGHGRAKVDSHFDLPIVDTSLNHLENSDFKVFRELASEKVWGMTAHIIYTTLDRKRIATTSPIVIDYIRSNLYFKNTLVSDDLCMYALHGIIGEKLALLKRVITLAKNEQNWKDKYSKRLKELFNIDTYQIGHPIIIEICQKKLLEIKPEFLESLSKVTTMTLRAGCDIVLHCSGDIEEMQAVCNAYK